MEVGGGSKLRLVSAKRRMVEVDHVTLTMVGRSARYRDTKKLPTSNMLPKSRDEPRQQLGERLRTLTLAGFAGSMGFQLVRADQLTNNGARFVARRRRPPQLRGAARGARRAPGGWLWHGVRSLRARGSARGFAASAASAGFTL